ncbi:MAG TPA: helix-turn-helix transcriptional regulator [Chryseosolibacter sp.]|nr:helix-turn-helix transcriptional regulator [Chryseosolibacter sp.]
MQIKKFEIEYGGYGWSQTIARRDNALVYSSWDVRSYPGQDVQVIPTEGLWQHFLAEIKPLVKGWRQNYHLDVCDGVCWSVGIETDDLKVRSQALHLFPENFAEFLQHVRRLIGSNEFADDFRANAFLSCTLVPHWINKRIRRLMRSKKIKMREMAERLRFDQKELRHLLNSPETFDIEYFPFISHVLGVTIADLLYESTLDEKPTGK